MGRGTSLLGRGSDHFYLSLLLPAHWDSEGAPTGSDLTPGLEPLTLVTTAGGRFLSGVKGVRRRGHPAA